MSSSSEASSIHAPRHPVPSMRAAFEESVIESDGARRSSGSGMDSSRRQRRGRRRPGQQQHHRLHKLVAQIAFGLYLLHDGLAKSDSAVVRILQGHINDMDEFLSTTTADFAACSRDITARLAHLQVPLDETGGGIVADVFDKMLESREFRREMTEPNEKVDFVIQRTTVALQTSLRDVREGLAAVDELAKYLLELKDGWRKPNLNRVYSAMSHNVALWFRCCVGLQMKGARLGEKLNQLQAVVQEIERRTAAASRKYKGSAIMVMGQSGEPLRSPPLRSPLSSGPRLVDKPLPEPPRSAPAIPTFEIQIPHRTSSSRPYRRLSKRHSRSSPQISGNTPLPSSSALPGLDSPQEMKAPRKSISMRFRQHFRGSKSMSELKRRMDKGKQREVPVEEVSEFSSPDHRQQNGNAPAPAPTAPAAPAAPAAPGLKRQKSRIFPWRSPRHDVTGSVTGSPRINRINSAATGPPRAGGGLLRKISTLVLRRKNIRNRETTPQIPTARRAYTTPS